MSCVSFHVTKKIKSKLWENMLQPQWVLLQLCEEGNTGKLQFFLKAPLSSNDFFWKLFCGTPEGSKLVWGKSYNGQWSSICRFLSLTLRLGLLSLTVCVEKECFTSLLLPAWLSNTFHFRRCSIFSFVTPLLSPSRWRKISLSWNSFSKPLSTFLGQQTHVQQYTH